MNCYSGKTVLITGHTGFKGSWLSAWMLSLGAKVVGLSNDIPTKTSHFEALKLGTLVEDLRVDVRDSVAVKEAVKTHQPDYVFHLAAQALVRPSYESPLDTIATNALGSANILDALRGLDKPVVVVMITSDKVYDNVEWTWGYRETDRLGGKDPYSASKGMAELVIRSYIESFFKHADSNVCIGIARAGNVIGGGDWAADRIVPDCVKAWSTGKLVELRNPHSTRPWQHVLEPLSGYLSLAIALSQRPELHGEPFNFGPQAEQNHSVLELVQQMALHWDQVRWQDVSGAVAGPYESGLLKLNCDKSLHYLQWHAVMGFEDTVRMTAEWYRAYYQQTAEIALTTDAQIAAYTAMAKQHGLAWAQ
jgi:CDP-glucose 4,6-dehydratase